MATHQQVTAFIYRLLRSWNRKGYSPMSINCGDCDSFAQDLLTKFPEGQMFWGDEIPKQFRTDVDPEGHCFFKFKGRYYDSESPKGVSCPDQLHYYLRIPHEGEVRKV